jgi:hypothetical protein
VEARHNPAQPGKKVIMGQAKLRKAQGLPPRTVVSKKIYKAEWGEGYYITGATSPEDAKVKAQSDPRLPAHVSSNFNFEEASAEEQRMWAGKVCLCNHSDCVN